MHKIVRLSCLIVYGKEPVLQPVSKGYHHRQAMLLPPSLDEPKLRIRDFKGVSKIFV